MKVVIAVMFFLFGLFIMAGIEEESGMGMALLAGALLLAFWMVMVWTFKKRKEA